MIFLKEHQQDIFNKLMFAFRVPHVAVIINLLLPKEVVKGRGPVTRESWVRH